MDSAKLQSLVLGSVLLPALIALTLMLPWAWIGRRRERAAPTEGAGPPDPVRASWVAALAFALALVPATIAGYGNQLSFPPHEGGLWAVYAPALAAVLGITLVLVRTRPWVRWGVGFVAGIALTSGVLWRMSAWPGREISANAGIVFEPWHVVVVGLAIGGVWIGIDTLCRRASALHAGVALWIVAAIASQAFIAAGSEVSGKYAASLAAVLGAAWVAGLVRRSLSIGAAAPVIASLYSVALLSAVFFPVGSGQLPLVGRSLEDEAASQESWGWLDEAPEPAPDAGDDAPASYPLFSPPEPKEDGGMAGASILLLLLAPVAPLGGAVLVRETHRRRRLLVMAGAGAAVAGAGLAPMAPRLLELVRMSDGDGASESDASW